MKRLRILLIIVGALLILVPRAWAGVDDKFLAAVRQVESSGRDHLVGDGGEAIGPYQIHKAYWKDATNFDKTIGGTYKDCFNPEYAKKVVKAYLRRYAPKDASYETLARIHNGGPKGHLKRATIGYWKKIKEALH